MNEFAAAKKFVLSLFRWRNFLPFLALLCVVLWEFSVLPLDIMQVIVVILSIVAVDMIVERNKLWEDALVERNKLWDDANKQSGEIVNLISHTMSRMMIRADADTFFARHRSRPSLDQQIEYATYSIDVCGISLGDVVQTVSAFQQKLRSGCKIRLLTMDPGGQAVREVCKRYNIDEGDVAGMQQLIRLNLRRLSAALCDDHSSSCCEIKVLDHRLPTGYFIVDREKDSGRMHVEILLLDKSRCPLFILDRQGGDKDWYDIFVADFEQLWDKATPWVTSSR